MKRGRKKRSNTLDKYIVMSITMITIYTIVHTVIFAITGKEAKILDTLFYTTFGLEILYCFLIKRLKLHEEAKIVFGKKKTNSVIEDEIVNEE